MGLLSNFDILKLRPEDVATLLDVPAIACRFDALRVDVIEATLGVDLMIWPWYPEACSVDELEIDRADERAEAWSYPQHRALKQRVLEGRGGVDWYTHTGVVAPIGSFQSSAVKHLIADDAVIEARNVLETLSGLARSWGLVGVPEQEGIEWILFVSFEAWKQLQPRLPVSAQCFIRGNSFQGVLRRLCDSVERS